MRLEFCPKCGRKMELVAEGGRIITSCPHCGFTKESSMDITRERYIRQEKKVVVVEEDVTPLPTVEIECPKCGHREAYSWTVQTRSGDESETQFFKCKKCGHVWRLYT